MKDNQPGQGVQYNAITQGSKIVGNVNAETDFRMDGTLEGDLTCRGRVIIGQSGLIRGKIFCENAEVHGRIEGQLQVNDTLTLRKTAQMLGDVKTNSLIVEPGAAFNGGCMMGRIDSTQPLDGEISAE
ncbi:MAG: polymer-forming cytoskeletal protein [Paludibacteraceae bacterium]|nr:polymer-forming cytoskeletal protein [Paludibacteraceae bacterium]